MAVDTMDAGLEPKTMARSPAQGSLPPASAADDWLIGGTSGGSPLVFRSDGTLWQEQRLVRLPPLQQRLLRSFCRRMGQVVQREELIEEVWASERVTEQSLARGIHLLRRLLDDCGQGSRSISTLYGSGYIFTLPVQPLAAGATAPDRSGAAPAANEPAAPPLPVEPPDPEEPPALAAGDSAAGATPPGPTGAAGPAAPARVAVRAEILQAREHLNEARLRLQRRSPAVLTAALRHLHEAERLAPGQPSTRISLSQCLLLHAGWGLRDSAECARAIQTLLKGYRIPEPLRAGWRCIEAETLSLLLWQPQACEEHFGPELRAERQRGAALWFWARHLLSTGRPAEALERLRPHLVPELPSGWLLAAGCQWQQDDPEGAQRSLMHLLAVDPDDVGAHLLLALIRCQLGRTREAAALLDQVARLTRGSMPLQGRQQLLLTALAGGGEADTAALTLQELLREDRLPWPSLWALAALRCGARMQAGIWFDRAVERRCPLAPLLWHSPLLRPLRHNPSLRRFAAAMERFAPPGDGGGTAPLLG